MSFLKFWSSSKKGSSGGKRDDWDSKQGDGIQEPELEKRRLRHSLSISRSGRFKQRKRERSQIIDKPEIFDCQDGAPTASSSSSSSLASQTQSESDSRRNDMSMAHHYHSNSGPYRSSATSSPKFTCRDINTGMGAPRGGLRMGHPVVT